MFRTMSLRMVQVLAVVAGAIGQVSPAPGQTLLGVIPEAPQALAIVTQPTSAPGARSGEALPARPPTGSRARSSPFASTGS